MVWAWMISRLYALGARTELCFGHGCSNDHRLFEHERYYENCYGLCMDALMTVCSWNTTVIMVWAWISNDRMLLEHERCYVLSMDVLMTVCLWSTKVIKVWAWML